MFSLTALIFISIYLVCLFGSVFRHPIYGVVGYAINYCLYPADQWWGREFASIGFRFSFFMAVALALGMVFQSRKINFPGKFYIQEILFFLLVIWIFASSFIGLPSYSADDFAVKLFKVSIFLWMLIRIVDSKRNYEIFLWSLVLSTIYLSFEALGVSTADYGRIDRGIGGTDFAEGNFLAAHFAMVLPFFGVFFIEAKNKRRLLMLVAAVLIVNAIVLCRSRGVFLALGAGTFSAVLWAPKAWRSKIIALVVVGLIGSLTLVDKGFIERMGRINPNISDIEEQDSSAAGRILAWKAAIEMVGDHPLGIGQDNFSYYVGQYQPEIPGKDTHSTYLRALAELGIPGVALIAAMIWNAFSLLRRQKKRIEAHDLPKDLLLHVYAQSVALVIFLTAGLFITETYVEEFYWLLMFPVLLERVVDGQMRERGLVDDGVVVGQRKIAGLFERESAR